MTEQERYADNVMYVHEHLPTVEILAQLAEEAAELSHAALKLRRVMEGSNPAGVSKEQAIDHLYEEYADVILCWRLVELDLAERSWKTHVGIMHRKAERWRRRLEERADTSEWISLKDARPDAYDLVLILYPAEEDGKPVITVDMLVPDEERPKFYAQFDGRVPTHWMPLPEPPKEMRG